MIITLCGIFDTKQAKSASETAFEIHQLVNAHAHGLFCVPRIVRWYPSPMWHLKWHPMYRRKQPADTTQHDPSRCRHLSTSQNNLSRPRDLPAHLDIQKPVNFVNNLSTLDFHTPLWLKQGLSLWYTFVAKTGLLWTF